MEAAGGLWQWQSRTDERRLLEILSSGLVGIGAFSALLLCFLRMPYGRYSTGRFGYPVPARLAWTLQELPSLLVPLGLSLFSGAARLSEWPNRILLALFIVHYAHRCGLQGNPLYTGLCTFQIKKQPRQSKEDISERALIFPVLIRGGKPTPFIVFALALIFCVYNGYLQGRSLSNYAEYPSGWLKGPCFIVGFAGWLSGMAINIYSDHILRNLRKPGETGYKIPRGGLFEYVTGANFFGEILEWFGFALASCTFESAAFAICTLFILGSRAHHHHQWYLEKFEDYPKSRKIVIPFVF
ncbi:3-oxo-5-alpha-steroid 4-dehydrogenase 1 isoform X2 [Natator depressus]|uniref:3-oxo-5-alpha-steroid 4-dehydrogenase 1 isoform X2 n=1 Tax=Natator depressus TaxID=27790 RepID=UPI003EBF5A52